NAGLAGNYRCNSPFAYRGTPPCVDPIRPSRGERRRAHPRESVLRRFPARCAARDETEVRRRDRAPLATVERRSGVSAATCTSTARVASKLTPFTLAAAQPADRFWMHGGLEHNSQPASPYRVEPRRKDKPRYRSAALQTAWFSATVWL